MHAPAAKFEAQEERTQRQLAALRELGGLALQLARYAAHETLHSLNMGIPSNRNGASQHFERLAKCVRETIALENRITDTKSSAPFLQPDDLNAVGRLFKSPNGAAKSWKK